MESDFSKINGVTQVTSGYDGGFIKSPTYALVSSGKTDYVESIRVVFDPKKITYPKLLQHFWKNIDPFDSHGQFCDKGKQYRSVIFYLTPSQKEQAITSKNNLSKKIGAVSTEILPSSHFYSAEKYHQQYAKKNPLRYRFYRYQCGRDARLNQLWKN